MIPEESYLIKRLYSEQCPFVAFWFPWYWRNSDTSELRKVVGRNRWETEKRSSRKVLLVIKTILWPVIAIAATTVAWLFNSKTICEVSGRGRTKQLFDLLYFSLWWGFPPINYYSQNLYFYQLSTVLNDFLSTFEMRTLNWKINRIHDVQIVDNKYQFGRLCQEFKLPVLPTIAAFEKGKVADDRDDFSIPKTDIYFKPSNGMKGYGIERWNYNAESDLWIFEHQKTNETELKNRFKEASKREDFIIQEAAYNHPAIEGLSEGGLISFRVITVIGGINDVDLIAAFINIPIGNSHVSQRVHGGILAQLDLDTGRVKSAIKVNPKLQKITHHPQTGVEIAGFVFKEWLQLVALAKKAHKMFPSIFSIGWDLAFTRNGPEILEGNTAWGMTPGVMVGRSNYCRWYLEFLERDKAQGGKLGSLLN